MSTIDVVVREGLCVGCGACSVITEGRIKMMRNELNYMQADLTDVDRQDIERGSTVCPFSSRCKNESELAQSRFSDVPNFDSRIGYYRELFAGRIKDDAALLKSSSGGMTSWLLVALMQSKLIDGVIHLGAVSRQGAGDDLFQFRVSRTVDEVLASRKSQYYSASFDQALLQIRGDGRRYAVVGVPCYIRGARALAESDAIYQSQLKYFVALVCGHMKSGSFAELLAWQVGVAPTELAAIDFRVKNPKADAGGYHVAAVSVDGLNRGQATTRELFGGNWGHAVFQLKACDFCDDIFGETADVCLGDAWIERYAGNWRGTNIVVVRDALISKLIETDSGLELALDAVSEDDVVRSQDGNFRHRWDGLSVRLKDRLSAGLWVPDKRIKAGSRDVPLLRRMLVRVRRKMSDVSHRRFLEAKKSDDAKRFYRSMMIFVKSMNLIYKLMRLEARFKNYYSWRNK